MKQYMDAIVKPIAGPGIRISESPAGFHINADIRPGSAPAPKTEPLPWTVRRNNGKWQVCRPLWYPGNGNTVILDGESQLAEWVDLPASVLPTEKDTAKKELYALLKHTYSAGSSEPSLELSLTNTVNALSDSETTRYLWLKIGEFSENKWTQFHTGTITVPAVATCFVPGAVDLIAVDGRLSLVQYWDRLTVSHGTVTRSRKVTNPNAQYNDSLGTNKDYAFVLPTADHADDHTEGLIPVE